VETERRAYALKWSGRPLPRMFACEADGLRRMAATRTVRVPEVFAVAEDQPGQMAFILMEYLDGSGQQDQGALGEALAEMHRQGTAPQYGLDEDNYIGAGPQVNGWESDWVTFFAEKRLRPQHYMAMRSGKLHQRRKERLEKLIEHLPELLGGVQRRPALLHGDLWAGNVIPGPGGVPALIDPAVYYGDREAEIAFTHLFGGFSTRFYAAYQAAWPLEPGFERRREIYNLYHLLNHLNIFGEGYGSAVDEVLGSV
jgi:fructosamine-3-kinase